MNGAGVGPHVCCLEPAGVHSLEAGQNVVKRQLRGRTRQGVAGWVGGRSASASLMAARASSNTGEHRCNSAPYTRNVSKLAHVGAGPFHASPHSLMRPARVWHVPGWGTG